MCDRYSLNEICDSLSYNITSNMTDSQFMDFICDMADDGFINDSTDFARFFTDPDEIANRLLDLAVAIKMTNDKSAVNNRLLDIILDVIELGINEQSRLRYEAA